MPRRAVTDLLDRDSPMPLFFQLRQRLLALVAGWDVNARFLTDAEIASRFGISRTTVRQAVDGLVHEGLLRRARGSGTWVLPRRLEEKLSPGMNIRSQWQDAGLPMQISVLKFERIPAGAWEADMLRIELGEDVLSVRRLRSAAGVSVAIDDRCLPADVVADWTPAHAEGSLLHQLWEQQPLTDGNLEIEAALAGPDEIRHLGVSAGAPVVVRTLRYANAAGRIVLAGRSVHRADLMRYSIHIPLRRDAIDIGGVLTPNLKEQR